MAVLLVAMAVMAVMMTVAMPVWKQASQREKEQELIFRGLQYSRAIGLFERKYANTPPPTLDVLVKERFLRKKYKDPITNTDFVPVTALAATTQPGAGPTGRGTNTPPAPGAVSSLSPGSPAGEAGASSA